jgi:hypothetical protein
MNELRIYIIMRHGEPLAAYSTPMAASLHLMRESSGLRIKSLIVEDMHPVPVQHIEERELKAGEEQQ